jgi:hypothetical protein
MKDAMALCPTVFSLSIPKCGVTATKFCELMVRVLRKDHRRASEQDANDYVS